MAKVFWMSVWVGRLEAGRDGLRSEGAESGEWAADSLAEAGGQRFAIDLSVRVERKTLKKTDLARRHV